MQVNETGCLEPIKFQWLCQLLHERIRSIAYIRKKKKFHPFLGICQVLILWKYMACAFAFAEKIIY